MKLNLKKIKVPFTQVPNPVLNNKDLDLKLKGLFSYLQSKPNDWSFSGRKISLENKDGVKSILAGLRELEELGYLKRKKKGDNSMIYELLLPKRGQKAKGPKQHGAKTAPYNNIIKNNNKENIIYKTKIHEENAIKIRGLFEKNKIPKNVAEVFDWRWVMIGALKRQHLFFIGLYWKKKDFKFANKQEASGELKRLTKRASEYLIKYPLAKFQDMLDWIDLDSSNKGGYSWGFETLDKRLAIYNQDNEEITL